MEASHRTHPIASVIVPARNARATLPACLRALREQTLEVGAWEIILVDDGSTDDTAAIGESHGVRVLSIPGSGPAVARNRGVAISRGEILVFTDADCAPDPGWLEAMLRPFERDSVVATKGVYRTEQQSLTARFVQVEYESRYAIMAELDSIDFVDTYAAAYRRRVFLEVGGFDESFPLPSVEDQELSFRIVRQGAEQGARMVFCPDAVVRHRHVDTVRGYFRKKLKIALWKVAVLRRFPERAVRDSHTPMALKVEILLCAAVCLTAPLALVTGLWLPVAIAGTAFFTCSAPFLARVVRRDAGAAVLAPVLVFARALALGLGLVLGFVRPRPIPAEPRTGSFLVTSLGTCRACPVGSVVEPLSELAVDA